MRIIKTIFRNIHRYILWALISFVLWAWIFTLITDTVPAKKVTVFINAPAVADKRLEKELDQDLPKPIRMVKVHPLDYVIIGEEEIAAADILIIPESAMEENLSILAPIGEEYLARFGSRESYAADGAVYGIRFFDAASLKGPAGEMITYTVPELPAEDYYLCFLKKSLHAGGITEAADDAALLIAGRLFDLP